MEIYNYYVSSMWFYKYFDKIRVPYMLICYLGMSLAV